MANVDPNTLLRNRKYYFVKRHSSKNFSETDIIKMLELKKKPNIFVMFSERGFQQIVCIPICTNCGPLLASIFFFIRMRHSLNKRFSGKGKEANPIL